jgi:GTP-binding protein Era
VEAGVWTPEDEAVLEEMRRAGVPSLCAVNKIDRLKRKEALLPYLESLSQRHDFIALVPVSASKGEQVAALREQILGALPEGPNVYPDDQLSDLPESFFAAELLREQLTRRYAKELPYQLSVEIERFQEQDRLYRIHALIWVEKPAQKVIIIGRNGEALKAAARQARLEMERFFGCKVHLEVWVKVKQSWSSDEGALARLGYLEP